MAGNNHYSSCTCGWCVNYGGRSKSKPRANKVSVPLYSVTYSSITIPNAICPVCGELVFFYQNSYGSRVFFNDLGPPWPKHPCTDNSNAIPISNRHSAKANKIERGRQRQWEIENWIALRLEEETFEDGWQVLRCKTVSDDELVRILLNGNAEIAPEFPLYMKPWDKNGFCPIAYLDSEFEPQARVGFKFADWFFVNPSDARLKYEQLGADMDA